MQCNHGGDAQDAVGCNHGGVLNIPEFQVCQVSAYASVAQGSQYALIWPYETSINISSRTQEKEAPQENIVEFFS